MSGASRPALTRISAAAGDPEIYPIRALREFVGMSLGQLEQITGINRGRLSILERGVTPLRSEMLKIFAAITFVWARRLEVGNLPDDVIAAGAGAIDVIRSIPE